MERNIRLEKAKGDVTLASLHRDKARLVMIHLGATGEEADDLLRLSAPGYAMSGHFRVSQSGGKFRVKYRHQPYRAGNNPKNRPDVQAVRAYYRWRRSHLNKKPLPTLRSAWLRVIRIQLRDRRPDFTLRPYSCTFGPGPDKTAPLHYHVGHSNRSLLWGRYPPNRRLARRVRKLTVYPYYRVRGRYRKWRG